jgi:hypothetical protein
VSGDVFLNVGVYSGWYQHVALIHDGIRPATFKDGKSGDLVAHGRLFGHSQYDFKIGEKHFDYGRLNSSSKKINPATLQRGAIRYKRLALLRRLTKAAGRDREPVAGLAKCPISLGFCD